MLNNKIYNKFIYKTKNWLASSPPLLYCNVSTLPKIVLLFVFFCKY